ncbi:STAS/SEC14 domain-containing protein [Hyphomonadaceae bacterium ML37]|nr:STAS/SEC14 domain-containing protein [Hyphomonadaceae bacterium ML37]
MLKFRLSRQDKAAIDIRFEPDVGLISFLCEGVVTQDDLKQAQAEADRLADGRSVRAMMIDARNSSPGYPPGQLVEPMSAVLEELRIRRCAFVSVRGRDEILDVIETVTFPYAVRVRAFDSDVEARAWLLS